MHWTNRKPKGPGRWARRWVWNKGAWRIVNVWRDGGQLYADDRPLSDFGDGYQWSSEPYPEPLEEEETR